MHPVQQRLEENASLVVGIFLSLVLLGLFALTRLWREWPAIRRKWPRSVRLARSRPWTWLDVGLLFLAVYVFSRLGAWWLRSSDVASGSFAELVVGSLCAHAVIPALVTLKLIRSGVRFRRAFGGGSARFVDDLVRGGRAYFALLPVLMLVVMVGAALLKALNYESDLQNVLLGIGDADELGQRIYLALWAVLLAPVAEEIFFRGILFPVLLKHLRPTFAIAVVSCCFGLAHAHLPSFLPLTTLSIALCCAYVSTGSLVVPIAMHMAFNAVTISIVLGLG